MILSHIEVTSVNLTEAIQKTQAALGGSDPVGGMTKYHRLQIPSSLAKIMIWPRMMSLPECQVLYYPRLVKDSNLTRSKTLDPTQLHLTLSVYSKICFIHFHSFWEVRVGPSSYQSMFIWVARMSRPIHPFRSSDCQNPGPNPQSKAPFLMVAILAVASGALWFWVYWQMQASRA